MTITAPSGHTSRSAAPTSRGHDRVSARQRKSALATEFGISRETVYGYLRSETVAG
jgi:hypothetical protein